MTKVQHSFGVGLLISVLGVFATIGTGMATVTDTEKDMREA